MGFLSWLNDLFSPHEEYGTPSVTLTGQPVRSKAERVIADYFNRHSIPYNYEAMATTNDWFIFKAKISRPDFYLPQYNLFVEYWGWWIHLTWEQGTTTSEQCTGKMAQYRRNNIRFVSISLESIRSRLLLQKEIPRSHGVQSQKFNSVQSWKQEYFACDVGKLQT